MSKMSPEARWLNEQYVAKINAAVAGDESARIDELASIYESERWQARSLAKVWTSIKSGLRRAS